MKNYVDYPNTTDDDFVKVLLKKKEFYRIKDQDNKTDLCKTTQFQLLPHQKFQQQYITPNTPYNGVLLFHGLGTGKTSSAIAIAENFKDFLQQHGTKTYVLSNDIVKAGFINELLGYEPGVGYSNPRAGGTFYLDEIERHMMQEDPTVVSSLVKKAKKQINRYYEFMGYGKFANLALKITVKDKKTGMVTERYTQIRKTSKALYNIRKHDISNSVLIVDEVHNILPRGQSGSTESYRAYRAMLKVLKNSQNVKLVLMSGTPIFDKPKEILSILKLLLLNDKRLSDEELDVIEKVKLFHSGSSKLTKEAKELLRAYVPGYVSYIRGHNPLTFPKRIDIGIHVPNVLDIIKVVRCYMSRYQTQVYGKALLWDYEHRGWGFKEKSGYASVVVYDNEKWGKEGYHWMTRSRKRKNQILKGLKALKRYGCKLAAIYQNVQKSEGPVFISSEYVSENGIAVLEQMFLVNGYTKWPQVGSVNMVFASIIGETKHKERIRSAFASPDNADGSLIKILLGSPTVSEGMNLKNVRQVHILEPHENMSHIEQTIGRAIRHCSHVSLSEKKRKVEVYKYVASIRYRDELAEVLEDSDIPDDFLSISRDEWIYRIAEGKLLKTQQIEKILKEYAVDCPLFKSMNFVKEDSNLRCKLLPVLPEYKESELDKTTYDILKDTHEIYNIKMRIKELFAESNVWTVKGIVDMLGVENDQKRYVYLGLDELVRTREPLRNKYNRRGYIIYRGRYYIFNLEDEPTDVPIMHRDAMRPVLITKHDIEEFMLQDPRFKELEKLKELEEEVVMDRPQVSDVVQHNKIRRLRKRLSNRGVSVSEQYLGCVKRNGDFAIITPPERDKEKTGSVCHASAAKFPVSVLIQLALKLGVGEVDDDTDIKFEVVLNEQQTNFKRGVKLPGNISKKRYICSLIQEKMKESNLFIGDCPTRAAKI